MTLDNFDINNLLGYVLLVLLLSIFIRFTIALLQSLEVKFSEKKIKKKIRKMSFKSIYISFLFGSNPETGHNDLFYNFILGSIELFIYPILIRTNNLEIIGAWIGFKALAQWGKWKINRIIYNRFLLEMH